MFGFHELTVAICDSLIKKEYNKKQLQKSVNHHYHMLHHHYQSTLILK